MGIIMLSEAPHKSGIARIKTHLSPALQTLRVPRIADKINRFFAKIKKKKINKR